MRKFLLLPLLLLGGSPLFVSAQTCTAFTFQVNGLFHTPTPQNPVKLYDFGSLFPAAFNNNSFLTKITLEVDVKHGGWQPDTMNNNVNGGTLGSRHCIFLMDRNRYIANTFGQLMFRGPGKNNFHMEHNIDNDPTDYSGPVKSWNAYQQGMTYRFHYVYDAMNDQVELKIYDITGTLINNPQLVKTVVDTTTLDKVPPCNKQNTVNNKHQDPNGFEVQFGFTNNRAFGYEQYVPTYGWEYSNFKLVVDNECPSTNANAGANVSICQGNNTQLHASGGTDFQWSPASSVSNPAGANPTATPATTTTYTLTVIDSLGVVTCIDKDTVTVTVNPKPNVSAGNDASICPGGSVSLNGSGAAAYNWTANPTLSATNVANPIATPTATTSYILTGSNGNCQDKDTVMVTIYSGPTVNAGADLSICAGDSTILQVNGGSSFVWAPPLGLSATSISNPSAFPQNTTTYSVTVTDASGCSGSDDVTVNVIPLPNANAGADVSICLGDSIALQATGGSLFAWTPAIGLSAANIFNPIAFPQNTTLYAVAVAGPAGCTEIDTVIVYVNSLPAVNAGNDVSICPGSSVSLNGSGATIYIWNADPSLSSTTVASPVANPSATTSYILTGSNGTCSGQDTVVVTLYANAVADAGADISICTGDSALLLASGGNSFVWSPATGLTSANTANPSAFPQNPTTYTLTVTDANGCTDADDITIGVWSLPVVSLGADVTICSDGTASLAAAGTFSAYNWSNGGNTATINVSAAGTYSVVVTDANGCENSDAISVFHFPYPLALNDQESMNENAGTTAFSVMGNDTYGNASVMMISGPDHGTASLGTDGSIYYTPTPGYSGTDEITYMICDSICTTHCDTARLTIEILDDKLVSIPQGFSPNGDGINDQFVIEGLQSFPENELTVFNRWGDLVYKARPYENNWGGESRDTVMKLAGNLVLDGTYFYVLKLDQETVKSSYVIVHR